MKIAVLGYGTVGVGVYELLRSAAGLEPGPVLVRPGKADADFKVTDIGAIVGDPTVGAVAEVMGGVSPAYEYACAAIKAGKHFVTSNKALVAEKGTELNKLARENGVAFLFSAACGGGVPILHNLALARQSDSILSAGGILNGTTNYMLDAMQRLGMDYGQALKDAQRLGYAEADPAADVSGLDALRKVMLLSAAAWDVLPVSGLLSEGIESMTRADAEHIMKRGYICRLLGRAGLNRDGSVYACVEPVLVGRTAPEASVLENFNLARYEGRAAGQIVLIGQGAGRWPTASAVLRDLSGILRGERAMLSADCRTGRADNGQLEQLYYVRLPEELAWALPVQSADTEGGTARLITEPMSPESMHSIAKELRQAGAKLFFAAIGG